MSFERVVAFFEAMGFGRVVAFFEASIMVVGAFFVVVQPVQLPTSLRIILGTVVGALLVAHLFVLHQGGRGLRKTALGRPMPEEIDFADLIRAENFIDLNYPPASVDYFLRILTDMPSYLSRVDERMELDGRLGVVHTTLFSRRASSASIRAEQEKRVGASSTLTQDDNRGSRLTSDDGYTEAKCVLFPLVSVHKGLLFDGFEAYDQSGKVLPTLSQWEVRGLLVVALRALFRQGMEASKAPESGAAETTDQNGFRHTLLQVAQATVCATLGRNEAERKKRTENAKHLINGLPGSS